MPQFAIGNPGGPGRPRRSLERKYLEATFAATPVAQWRRVVEKALEQALDGDAAARAWLSKYLLGDDPLSLVELVDELKAALEKVRNGNGRPYQAGTPAPAEMEQTVPIDPVAGAAYLRALIVTLRLRKERVDRGEEPLPERDPESSARERYLRDYISGLLAEGPPRGGVPWQQQG
jgi:hypothetical protein